MSRTACREEINSVVQTIVHIFADGFDPTNPLIEKTTPTLMPDIIPFIERPAHRPPFTWPFLVLRNIPRHRILAKQRRAILRVVRRTRSTRRTRRRGRVILPAAISKHGPITIRAPGRNRHEPAHAAAAAT